MFYTSIVIKKLISVINDTKKSKVNILKIKTKLL